MTDRIVSKTSAASSKQRWVRVVLGLAVVLAVGAAALFLHESRAKASPPLPKHDIPRVEGKVIVIPEGFRERAGIALFTVHRATLVPQLRVVGTVDFDPAHVGAAGTPVPGLVRRLLRLEGDKVKAGEVLAEVESADLGEAQAQLSVALAQRRAADLNARREQDLEARGLSTAREHEVAAAAAEEQNALARAAQQRVTALSGAAGGSFGTYLLRAPIDGTIVERKLLAGQSVESHLVAFRVANLDHLWVALSVFEQYLDGIRKGDKVEIVRIGHEDEPIEGQIAYVGELVNTATRTADVRVAVLNDKRLLRPGQSVTAVIRSNGGALDLLTVPMSSVIYVDGKPTVFVQTEPNRVQPVSVELGPSDGILQGITSGLKDEQVVVAKGAFALKSELYR